MKLTTIHHVIIVMVLYVLGSAALAWTILDFDLLYSGGKALFILAVAAVCWPLIRHCLDHFTDDPTITEKLALFYGGFVKRASQSVDSEVYSIMSAFVGNNAKIFGRIPDRDLVAEAKALTYRIYAAVRAADDDGRAKEICDRIKAGIVEVAALESVKEFPNTETRVRSFVFAFDTVLNRYDGD